MKLVNLLLTLLTSAFIFLSCAPQAIDRTVESPNCGISLSESKDNPINVILTIKSYEVQKIKNNESRANEVAQYLVFLWFNQMANDVLNDIDITKLPNYWKAVNKYKSDIKYVCSNSGEESSSITIVYKVNMQNVRSVFLANNLGILMQGGMGGYRNSQQINSDRANLYNGMLNMFSEFEKE